MFPLPPSHSTFYTQVFGMRKSYKTIIVGAGPAGLNAGRFLKEEFLILDKKRTLGCPVQCAEGISIQALAREYLEPDPKWTAAEIRQIKRIMPGGAYWGDRQREPYAVVLKRHHFESHLADLVSGDVLLESRVVDVQFDGTTWRITTDRHQTFHSEYVIGADGPASRIARDVFGYRYDLAPAVNYQVVLEGAVPTDELQMFFGKHIAPRGYAWVFPVAAHKANIGLITKTDGKVRALYERFLDETIRPRFGAYDLIRQKSGALPISGFPGKVVERNVLLAGDAGAFADPIFSGGIGLALLTGRLAAQSINRNRPEHYQESIDNLPFSGSDLLKAREIFYNFDDETLGHLGDVLQGRSTSYIVSDSGKQELLRRPVLKQQLEAIYGFAKVWQAAKAYLW